MTVVPDGPSKKPITLLVPNRMKESRTIEVSEAVTSLAGQLKVGDTVNLTYESSAGKATFSSATVTPGVTEEDTSFTYAGTRKVTHRGKACQAVVASRGSLSWTFLLPDKDGSAADDSKKTAYEPDPELLKKLKEFRRGVAVRLTYKPSEFVFWLDSIEPVEPATTPAATAQPAATAAK